MIAMYTAYDGFTVWQLCKSRQESIIVQVYVMVRDNHKTSASCKNFSRKEEFWQSNQTQWNRRGEPKERTVECK